MYTCVTPFSQGKDPTNLAWYRQAEIVHCRFAMLGVAGIMGPDLAAKVIYCVLKNSYQSYM